MQLVRRELEVAFSLKAQPVWFRVFKWSGILLVTARYRRRWWFPYGVIVTVADCTHHGVRRSVLI